MESLSQGNNCFKETHVRFFKRVDRFRYCGRSGTYLSKQGRVRGLVKNVDNFPHLRNICASRSSRDDNRSEEHTSELQSRFDLVCRLLLENKNYTKLA